MHVIRELDVSDRRFDRLRSLSPTLKGIRAQLCQGEQHLYLVRILDGSGAAMVVSGEHRTPFAAVAEILRLQTAMGSLPLIELLGSEDEGLTGSQSRRPPDPTGE